MCETSKRLVKVMRNGCINDVGRKERKNDLNILGLGNWKIEIVTQEERMKFRGEDCRKKSLGAWGGKSWEFSFKDVEFEIACWIFKKRS